MIRETRCRHQRRPAVTVLTRTLQVDYRLDVEPKIKRKTSNVDSVLSLRVRVLCPRHFSCVQFVPYNVEMRTDRRNCWTMPFFCITIAWGRAMASRSSVTLNYIEPFFDYDKDDFKFKVFIFARMVSDRRDTAQHRDWFQLSWAILFLPVREDSIDGHVGLRPAVAVVLALAASAEPLTGHVMRRHFPDTFAEFGERGRRRRRRWPDGGRSTHLRGRRVSSIPIVCQVVRERTKSISTSCGLTRKTRCWPLNYLGSPQLVWLAYYFVFMERNSEIDTQCYHGQRGRFWFLECVTHRFWWSDCQLFTKWER